MRPRELGPEVGVGRHDRDHVDGPVERRVAGGLAERGDGVSTGEPAERVGDARTRLLEPTVDVGPRRVPEQVAVEADLHVVVGEGDIVMPQPVAQGRQPASLQLVRSPQLVERTVHHDDPGHPPTLPKSTVQRGPCHARLHTRRWL